ncbi:MAG: replicative DNA helicase [Sorangiineae bacterium]|nr:replicative DNA helicase [Polyangiaceae bacterium]MEB2322123.1 replicative DNA helicase [Sorangiineae bacterium]
MSRTYAKDRQRRGDAPLQLTPAAGRVPPHDLDAEGAVLSAILLDPGSFDTVQHVLEPEHFYSDANRWIFEAVLALAQGPHRVVDVVAVAGWLRDRERLQQIGGTPYLAQLADATPAVANVEVHAKTIREKYRLRQLIATCQRFAAEGYGDCGPVQDFIDQAEQSVFELARTDETTTLVTLRAAVEGAFEIISAAALHGGGVSGIPSGFTQLDEKCSGLHPGDLYVVAGRPGMGKTAFVLNLAVNVAKSRAVALAANADPYEEAPVEEPGDGVVFFSLEMPRAQLASRLLASEARVDVSRLRSGRLGPEDWNKLTEAAGRLSQMPLWLDDTPAITLLDVRARLRRLQAEIARGAPSATPTKRIGVVAIDYLQLMQGRRDAQSREQEISELSRGLKQLAKEMGVAVVALSQLNRSVETRNTKDKRPQLSDLRESGAIEQDADTILFIYRDEYYFKDSEQKGRAEVIIAKQRNGPTGRIQTRYTSEYTRFDNLAPEEYDFGELDLEDA